MASRRSRKKGRTGRFLKPIAVEVSSSRTSPTIKLLNLSFLLSPLKFYQRLGAGMSVGERGQTHTDLSVAVYRNKRTRTPVRPQQEVRETMPGSYKFVNSRALSSATAEWTRDWAAVSNTKYYTELSLF